MADIALPETREREAKSLVMRCLARREYSAYELEQRLQNKGFDQVVITNVLLELKSRGLQSDERFAEAYISARRNRGYGPVRIQMELHERGITSELSDEFINKQDPQWNAEARKVRNKRFGKKLPKTFDEKSRQAKFLNYRGFTQQQIKFAFCETTDNETDIH